MPELRWTLLIIGVLFVVILAWWERRRPHQASRQAPHISGEPRPVVTNDPSWGPEVESVSPRAVAREPTLTLPEIRTESRTRDPLSPRELPVVEIPDDVADRVEEAMAAGTSVIASSPSVSVRPSVANPPVVSARPEGAGPDAMHATFRVAPAGPQTSSAAPGMAPASPQTPPAAAGTAPVGIQTPPAAPRATPATPRMPPAVARTLPPAAAHTPPPARRATFESRREPDFDPDVESDADAEAELESEFESEFEAGLESNVEPVASAQPDPASATPVPVPNAVSPIVDWPPEDQRKLVSLRLVARPPERFRGSLVRQALRAEGFVLGDLDIFHKPDAQNRAVLSAASLTKPGTFDLETMDTQRFVGLNLFAVLPGPRTPQKAFEDLLLTARMLNERLEGALQDERGGPLTPTRIQALRDALGAEAKS